MAHISMLEFNMFNPELYSTAMCTPSLLFIHELYRHRRKHTAFLLRLHIALTPFFVLRPRYVDRISMRHIWQPASEEGEKETNVVEWLRAAVNFFGSRIELEVRRWRCGTKHADALFVLNNYGMRLDCVG